MTTHVDPQQIDQAATAAGSAVSAAKSLAGIMSAIENFWWTVGGVVVAAAITGLGWFVYTSTQDIATLKAQQDSMVQTVRGIHDDVQDIKQWLGAPSRKPQQQQQQTMPR